MWKRVGTSQIDQQTYSTNVSDIGPHSSLPAVSSPYLHSVHLVNTKGIRSKFPKISTPFDSYSIRRKDYLKRLVRHPVCRRVGIEVGEV